MNDTIKNTILFIYISFNLLVFSYLNILLPLLKSYPFSFANLLIFSFPNFLIQSPVVLRLKILSKSPFFFSFPSCVAV